MIKMRTNAPKWAKKIRLLGLLACLLLSGAAFAQQGATITGTTTDGALNQPLPGVNVVEKGTTNGTTSDFDGNYSITLTTDNAILVFSYVGYTAQEIPVGGNSQVNATLQEDAQALDEVVVVGYGTQKKSDLTGAIGTVGSDALTERNMTNPIEAIQGNIAGVQVSSSTGRLGDGFDMTIRGKNSISGNTSPLYVVDGVPTDGIDFLNPQDIAQIDVLKDASSTAIYGSRGSNGVVIVTTKSGTSAKGGFNLTFDTFTGIKNVARLPKMMDGDKWWYYHQSAYLATASTDPNTGTVTEETLRNAYAGTANAKLIERANNGDEFDWYDAVLQTGIQQNHYLDISGRAENGMSYNIGLGYQHETGNIQNEELDKYTLKTGVNHRINDKFSTGANITVTHYQNQRGSDVAMREAFRLPVFLHPWAVDANNNDIVGELYPQPGKLLDANGDYLLNKTSTYNPLLEIANSSDDTRRWNGIGTVYLQYNPLQWLSFKTNFAAGVDSFRRGKSWGAQTNRGISNNNLPSAEYSTSENFDYTWDNQVNIDYTFGKDHNVKFLGLQSIYGSRTETSFGSSRDQPFDTGFYNLGSGAQSTFNVGTNFVKQTLSSFALRLNYAFKDKYLVTLSNRWDGSSLFDEENRWDSFPTAALAWRITGEDFMTNQNVVSNLKLRAGYGFVGNNIIAPYSTLNNLDIQTYYDFNGSAANGFIPGSIANTDLTWEKTEEWNIGVDFGFLSNRINGSVDVYNRESKELLLEQQLPLESGFDFINANVGSVVNKGVEVALNTRIIQKNNISWDVNMTFTKNTNQIKSLYGQDEVDDVGNGFFIGESIDAQYNYKFDGIWQANETAEAASYNQSEGQAKVVDVNNDGVIDPEDDRMILGSADPDWTGSLFTSLRVGNFDLSASLITSQGSFVSSPFHSNFTDTRDRGRQKLDIDWYIPANDAGLEPQYSNSYPQPRNMGTFWRNEGVGYYRDVSFVKVKNIALGYNIGQPTLDKLRLKGLRVYANVLNPFVFTDYDGYDPEWADASLNIGRVSTITYQIGLSLKL